MKTKNAKFDFIYLFAIVSAISIFSIYIIKHDEEMIGEDSLSYLNLESFVMFVLIIPLMEELCFRGVLHLSKYMLFLSSIGIALIALAFFEFNIYRNSIIGLVLLLGALSIFKEGIIYQIKKFVDKNVIQCIIFTSLLFSLLHLTNYEEINIKTWLLMIPKFIGGFYLGYIAYKYGVSRSWFFHGLNNLIPFIIMILYQYLVI